MNKYLLFLPLSFFTANIIFSLLVFAFGPWPWPTRDSAELYMFMCLVVLAIYVGYIKGVNKLPGCYTGGFTVSKLYRISIFLTLVLFYPTLSWRTGGQFGLGLELLMNPAIAYLRSHYDTNVTGTAYIEYIRILLSFFLLLLIPYLIVYWEKWSLWEKTAGAFCILLNVYLWLSLGTNKGIGDIVIVMFWSLLIRFKDSINFRSILRFTLIFVPMAALFLFFFVSGQIDRHGGDGVKDIFYAINVEADRDGPVMRNLPPLVQEGVIAFTSYWVQGYNGLALSFDEPFVFCYGLGNSRIAATYADKYLGTDVVNATYPARVEMITGWDSKVNWHTIFPWLASDVTFPGSIVLIGFFSYLMALSWQDSICLKNPLAISMFSQLVIMFSYITANNQALQSGEGYLGFWVTLWVWLGNRKTLGQVVSIVEK